MIVFRVNLIFRVRFLECGRVTPFRHILYKGEISLEGRCNRYTIPSCGIHINIIYYMSSSSAASMGAKRLTTLWLCNARRKSHRLAFIYILDPLPYGLGLFRVDSRGRGIKSSK